MQVSVSVNASASVIQPKDIEKGVHGSMNEVFGHVRYVSTFLILYFFKTVLIYRVCVSLTTRLSMPVIKLFVMSKLNYVQIFCSNKLLQASFICIEAYLRYSESKKIVYMRILGMLPYCKFIFIAIILVFSIY